MSAEESFWQQLEAWKQSGEGKQFQRAIEIYENAALIYQRAIAAMHPVRIYTRHVSASTRRRLK